MSHVAGRRRGGETYPTRTASSGSPGSSPILAWGSDNVRENYTLPAAPDTPTAALLPPLPRDADGTPLQVDFPAWSSGDVLRVRWAGSALGVLSSGGVGLLIPRISVDGADYQFLDNASQLGLLGIPGGTVYAFGEASIALAASSTVSVQLGIFLKQGSDGDQLFVRGGPFEIPTNLISTWLTAERWDSSVIVSLPPASLSDLPLPGA